MMSDPIQAALQRAVEDGTFPGAVLAVRLRGTSVYEGAVGRLSLQWGDEAATIHTCYDLASLTKVLATTTALLLLIQRGQVALEDRIDDVLQELRESPVAVATVRQLLTHSSGLAGWRPYYERLAETERVQPGFLGSAAARQAVLSYIAQESLLYETGSRSLYSDLGFLLLGFAVERLSGEPLAQFCQRQIYDPLGAQPLAYLPYGGLARQAASTEPALTIAPTEEDGWRGRTLCGEVHDENAFAVGGTAGHAGLFGTVGAVLAVARAWLDGCLGKTGLLDPDLVQRFTMRQKGVPHSSWALGWDTPSVPSSSGRLFSPESFGHLGYTGTSLWIDPVTQLEVALLSNRVHPTRKNERIRAFRPLIHDLICQVFLRS
ncbi:MAG: putative Esterase, beta-lactamase family [Nitrospira sp.]|jgi:CubicO group peptidase (beta-lactamase class C family)|nr:putative Esterase, beta-lactamase family [Nitrospira sp.]